MIEQGEAEDPTCYEIIVLGSLDESWSEWFGGLRVVAMETEGGEITVLSGPVVDQAALWSVLTKIGDLNLRLLGIHRMDSMI